jgi:hypothetical protein
MSTDTMLDVLFWTAIVGGVTGGVVKRETPSQPPMFWIVGLATLAITVTLWIMWGNATGLWDIARVPLASLVATLFGSIIGTATRKDAK